MNKISQEIFLAGGCLWGVQEFLRHIPGVLATEAGRANGYSQTLDGPYDGYAECVRVWFDPIEIKVADLIEYLFEVIDPYSVDKQGPDSGRKYRTGVYSCDSAHLDAARNYIAARHDAAQIALEIAPLTNYLKSATEHQDRLTLHPDTPCHIPREILHKYHKIK